MSPTKAGLIVAFIAAWACAPTSLPAQNASAGRPTAARSQEVGGLIATLQSAEAAEYDKVLACHRLAVVGTPEAVPALAALLSDEKLAHMARYALEAMPDPTVDDALRAALGQLKGPLQLGVINSIGVRRDAKAVDGLIPLLSDPDPEVVMAAAAALGRIGTPKCATALQTALARAQATTRPALGDACLVYAERLVAQNQKREATALYDLLLTMDLPVPLHMAAMRGTLLTQGSAGVPLLVEQLKSPSAGMVAIALNVARELQGTDVTQALAAELGALPEEKQALLLVALGDRGDKAALPAVLASAESGSPGTRVASLHVLARLGDVSSVPLLLACASDPDPDVAQAAQATLAMLPGVPVDNALLACLGSGENRVRLVAIEAVAQRRLSSAVLELSRAASDPDAGVRVAALNALGATVGLTDLALLTEALVQAASREEISAANAALEEAGLRIQDKAAIAEELLAVLPQAGPEARGFLMFQLAQVGGANSLQAVCKGTQDPDGAVRAKAVRALADWPDAAAVPKLAEIVRATPDGMLRSIAFRGYVRLVRESEAAADEKVRLLEQAAALASDTQDRRIVLSALGETYSLDSLRLVASYLSDPELADEVGAAAVKLSVKLGARHKDELSPVLREVLKSAKSKPVLDAAREQMSQLGIPAE